MSRRFGRRVALHPTDLELRAGEVVVLAGPNGAGKSTLLGLLAGALQPTAGLVERHPDVEIGWAPQRPGHYGRLTPRENLELFARLADERDPAGAALRLLAEFGLPDDGLRAAELSVGNQQRLNLAIAFVGAPSVLLLDEPTAALDSPQRRLLWARIDEIAGAGAGVVVATQSAEELARADRVLVLVEGRPEFDGPPSALPDSAVAEALA